MLLGVLYRTDALFWPCRSTDMDTRRAIDEMRAEYRTLGLPWRVGGADAGRQAGSREIDALGEAGRLIVARTKGRQSAFVKLPDAVDTELRNGIGLPGLDYSLRWLGHLAEDIADGRCLAHCGQTWVRETHLAGCEYGQADTHKTLAGLGDCMLPLLIRGLADSNADSQGRVWYCLTPAGEAIAKREGAIDYDLTPPDSDDAAFDAYMAAKVRELGHLASIEPRNPSEIGPIPLPVGV